MSMTPEPIGPIPAETERVARAVFPKGNRAMQRRDHWGAIYDDTRFAKLFTARGRPAEAPWRLTIVTVLQFAEGRSDRQAAAAVRGRIDGKDALSLPLEDPGFDFLVRSEFRTRLGAGNAAQLLLDALLDACQAHGLLRARGRQRTDSTHVLGALRGLNRREQVAETGRAAREAVAAADPAWLRAQIPADWFTRSGRRSEDDRLPQAQQARAAFARQGGEDGMALLTALFAPDAPPALQNLRGDRRDGGGAHLGDQSPVHAHQRLTGLRLEEQNRGVVGRDALIVRVERDELHPESPGVRRHQAEKTLVLSDRDHHPRRLDHVAGRERRERTLHRRDHLLQAEVLADGFLIQVELHRDNCPHTRFPMT
jgi:transposase